MPLHIEPLFSAGRKVPTADASRAGSQAGVQSQPDARPEIHTHGHVRDFMVLARPGLR